MNGDDIEKLLRALPRQKASPEFTPRLLSKLDRRSSSPAAAWLRARPLRVGAATLLLLGTLTSGVRYWYELRERADAVRRVEALRNEYEAIERELEELHSLAAASQPVVDLVGTEDVDILLDLRTLAAATERVREAQHQPADYRQ